METIQRVMLRKRDGRLEPFCERKLAGCLMRGMVWVGADAADAAELAKAVHIFLQRNGQYTVSSRAVFEMCLKVLGRVRMKQAAELLELHRSLRAMRRRQLSVLQDDGRAVQWDKAWLSDLACRIWNISSSTARILAGEIENELLELGKAEVRRSEVMVRLNRLVAAYGLADAVPVSRA